MKTFKKIIWVTKRLLPSLLVVVAILGSFPTDLFSNTQIRQEINIIDKTYSVASGSYATSSEIATITDINYSSPTYYFEVDASTTSATTATVSLVNATSGEAIANTSVTIGGTAYARYRSAAFNPIASSTSEYKVLVGNQAVGKKVIAARIVVLQNASTFSNTETQIEIGDNEVLNSTATSTLNSPKYWSYNSSKWDGSPTFAAEVTYQVLAGVASSTAYNTAGTYTVTLPASTASTSIQLIGGGGAGGSSIKGSRPDGGAGGAGGQFAQSTTTANGITHTLVVAGIMAGSSEAAGNNGNDSTWDTTAIVAKGGTGGLAGTGGVVASTTGSTTGCVGQTCFAGGSSGGGTAAQGGAGGGGAGTTGAGGTVPAAGTAGAGTANGGSTGGAKIISSASGSSAATPGGGGGGGGFTTTNTTRSGGQGAGGRATTTSIMASTTIALQEDDGAFGSWADKVYMVTTSSQAAGTSTRYRTSFTPVNGKHYRIAYKVHDARDVIAIYDAKIIVDQLQNYLGSASYDSKSFSFNSQDTLPWTIFFNSDKSTMYALGVTNNTIYQYTLSTPGDVSTATYASKSFSLAGQDSQPRGLFFSSDGTTMYMTGVTNDFVYQYTLSSPDDISTASYASKSFSNASQDGNARAIFFNSDRSKMYLGGGLNTTMYQYTLSSPGDVSTASYASKSFNISGSAVGGPMQFSLNADGSKMYVLGSGDNTVYQYTLSTPGDMSTASYDGVSFSGASQDSGGVGLFIDYTNSKMYYLGSINKSVYQYSLSAAPTLLEPQYLVAPTKLSAGTALQGYLTKWDSTEWSGVTNTYLHQADAAASSGSAVGINTAAGTLVVGSTITSPNNSATSTSMTMPSNGDLDVKATTNNNDIYANRILVQVAKTAATALSQAHYRWRNDDGTESSATYSAAEDTPLTSGIYVGDRERIRFLISDTAGLATGYTYQLEQSSSTCTSWIAVPSTESAGTHWVGDISQYFIDGGATTNSASLTDPGGSSFVNGYMKAGQTITPALSLTSAQFTENEYTIRSTSAVSVGTTYCFRLTNAGVATGFTYSQTPQISVLPNVNRPTGGGGGTVEGGGSGSSIGGGNSGGGSGNSGGEGGGSGGSQGGGNKGGGGGGDTGFLFQKNFFALFMQLPVDFKTDPLFSVKIRK